MRGNQGAFKLARRATSANLAGRARRQKQARSPDYYTSRAHKSDYLRARRESHDCVRAQSLDLGGDYKAYPCWARAALAPKDLR
jgi:hypothetical protein